MKTRRGIYRDLKMSEWTAFGYGIKFYFSSRFYRDKFVEEVNNDVKRFNGAINKTYRHTLNIEVNKMACLRLYSRIEKRGFYITVGGIGVDCLENLTFVSEIRIEAN
jgi:hypothetical protein